MASLSCQVEALTLGLEDLCHTVTTAIEAARTIPPHDQYDPHQRFDQEHHGRRDPRRRFPSPPPSFISDDEATNFMVNPFGSPRHARERLNHDNVARRWEFGLKIDFPEFDGSLEVADYVDWIHTVEELLEYKEVPDDRRVTLMATRLRGRASSWWQ